MLNIDAVEEDENIIKMAAIIACRGLKVRMPWTLFHGPLFRNIKREKKATRTATRT